MKRLSRYFSGLSAGTFLLAFASFFSDISTEMLYPILPVFLTETLKTPASIVGVVEGVATATQYIVQGFSGWLSDKLQKRKSIALVGYFLSAISKPLIGLSTNWPQVVGGRFVDRLGAGTRTAPRDGLIAASATETTRGKAFGLEGIGDNLGAFVGPLLALLFLFALNTPIRTIFYIAAIPGFIAVVLILFVKEKKVTAEHIKIDTHFSRYPKGYWLYILSTAIFGIGNSSNAFLILRTKDIGIPLFTTILIYACFNLVAALSSYPAGHLSDTVGRKGVLVSAFVIFIMTYLGFALTKNIFLIGFLFILYGMYSGAFRTVGKALATDFVPSELRSSAVGWYSSTIGITGFIASLVAGELWVKVSPESSFLYGALFAVAGTVSLLLLVKKTQ